MRVACIGNMNNLLFSLVRYLRDRGIDAHLLLCDFELSHFHPSWDSYDLEFQGYTTQLDWGRERGLDDVSSEHIRKSLEPYDFIIACGPIPAFVHKAGRQLDVFLTFGDDIYRLPFQKRKLWKRSGREIARFVRAQRGGISEAGVILTAPYLLPWAERLGVRHKSRCLAYPALYDGIYAPGVIERYHDRSAWYREFLRVREKFDLLAFHHSRLIWKTFVDPTVYKGNERLLYGFASFVGAHPESNAGLALFEFGIDIEPTRQLVCELGLEKRVQWFPAMARKEIMIGLNMADVSLGQFGMANFGGGTVYESLAMGKPVIQYRDDAKLTPEQRAELPPIIDASQPEEIARGLEAVAAAPEAHREMGTEAYRWHKEKVVRASVDRYVELIEAREKGVSLTEAIGRWPDHIHS